MWFTIVYPLKRWYHFFKTGLWQGWRSQLKYRFPEKKLTIITLTGTDGKTTTSTLVYHLLRASHQKVALISTVAAYVGDDLLDTGFHVTSPDPRELYKIMARLVAEGYRYLVLEATSHGVYQYRTWGIKPTIAGLTNIAREHFDYHGNYDNYVDAKVLLLNQAQTVILNEDDQSFSKVKKRLRAGIKTLSYQGPSDLAKPLQAAIKARFPELYNQMNATLAASICLELGMSPSALAAAIPTFSGVPGRMQAIPNQRGLEIIVDFAHTPQAVEAVLTTLRSRVTTGHSLIAVYGSAGLRDRGKRPLMGAAGAKIADLVVLTAEDPRTEDVWAIIRQMKSSLGEAQAQAKVISIPDRQAAITFAIQNLARKGDVVAILGKGHEQSMNFNGIEYPWSDQKAVAQALQAKK